MLSAPVCPRLPSGREQAGWLNAECKLKNAKSPSVKLERWHVCTLERWNWELEIGKWELGISIFCFPFPFPSLCAFTKLQVRKFAS